ncbi:MAG: XRE family transcriptional regulator [Alphaproteobacteria bacterium]|nr:XRE family transcriptional regulator [Alphaproteobacteria bacterium]
MKTIKAANLHARRMKGDPDYREAYGALDDELALINSLINARARAHLSQAEVASRMGTTESAVSRLESGRIKSSTRTLERYAEATGHKLRISLEPASH